MLLHGQGEEKDLGTSTVLLLDKAEDTFVFTEVAEQPVPSLLRGFSAPVKLVVEGQDESQLIFLLAHDSDSFNRWEAGQRLLGQLVARLYAAALDPSKVGRPPAPFLACLPCESFPFPVKRE